MNSLREFWNRNFGVIAGIFVTFMIPVIFIMITAGPIMGKGMWEGFKIVLSLVWGWILIIYSLIMAILGAS